MSSHHQALESSGRYEKLSSMQLGNLQGKNVAASPTRNASHLPVPLSSGNGHGSEAACLFWDTAGTTTGTVIGSKCADDGTQTFVILGSPGNTSHETNYTPCLGKNVCLLKRASEPGCATFSAHHLDPVRLPFSVRKSKLRIVVTCPTPLSFLDGNVNRDVDSFLLGFHKSAAYSTAGCNNAAYSTAACDTAAYDQETVHVTIQTRSSKAKAPNAGGKGSIPCPTVPHKTTKAKAEIRSDQFHGDAEPLLIVGVGSRIPDLDCAPCFGRNAFLENLPACAPGNKTLRELLSDTNQDNSAWSASSSGTQGSPRKRYTTTWYDTIVRSQQMSARYRSGPRQCSRIDSHCSTPSSAVAEPAKYDTILRSQQMSARYRSGPRQCLRVDSHCSKPSAAADTAKSTRRQDYSWYATILRSKAAAAARGGV
eukprot:gene21548-28541_t